MIVNRVWLRFFMVALIGFGLFPIYVNAQSLEDLQAHAVNNRKLIEAKRLSIANQDILVKRSHSNYYPKFDMRLMTSRYDDNSVTDNTSRHEYQWSMTYPIFLGLKNWYGVKNEKILKEIKTYELNSLLQDIKFQIAETYLYIFEGKSRLEVATDEYLLLKKRHEDVQNRLQVGLVNKNDVLKIKVEMDNARQKMEKASADYDISINEMEHQTGIAIQVDAMTFKEFNGLPEAKDYAYYKTQALNRSELKALELLIQSKKYQTKVAQSEFYPSINLVGSYKKFHDEGFPPDSQDDEDKLIKLELTMNLFDGFNTIQTVQSEKLNEKIAECNFTELKQSIETEVKNIYLEYEVSLKNLKVAHESIAQAEENFRITDISFQQGVATTTDVLDAIYYRSRAKYNFIYAGGELFLHYYQLQRIADNF